MGLDMYLTAKRGFYSNLYEGDGALMEAVRAAMGIEGFEVGGVEIRAGYWRKANAIHKWFVDNVQDGNDECQETPVSREDLRTLRDLCDKALNMTEAEREKALPTQSGFFFGATDYDEGYVEDLKHTIAVIDEAMKLDVRWTFTYQSSW